MMNTSYKAVVYWTVSISKS